MSDNEEQLKQVLKRLEVSTQKIIKTRGYSSDAKTLKILEETIREQLIHANSRPSTRTIR